MGAARCSELEVDQRDRDPATEHDVGRLHVVVTHECSAQRVSQRIIPGVTLRVELAARVVQPAQQLGDGGQRGVGLAPVRVGCQGHVAIDELEAFAFVFVESDGPRNAVEPGMSHRSQKRMNRTSVYARGAEHVRADADDPARVRDSAFEMLLDHIGEYATR